LVLSAHPNLADLQENDIFAGTLESSLVMKAQDQYILPLKSIKEGTKILEFELGKDFFKSFDNELIGECSIHQKIIVEKRSEFLLLFSHHGYMKANCDRCLELIKIPLSAEQRFVLKFVEDEQEDEEEIIYLSQDQDRYDLAPLINEVITLSVPMVKVYDCQNDESAPCNREVLKYLHHGEPSKVESQIWDQLKKLKLED